jgi:hypothetical protein
MLISFMMFAKARQKQHAARSRLFYRSKVMRQLKKNFLAAATVLTLTTLLVIHPGLVRAGKVGETSVSSSAPAVPSDRPDQAPVAAQGMRVYRDPQTGRLGSPPPGVQPPGLSIAEQRMLSRSDQGLQLRTLPRGGVAVDLQGRYQNMAVATVGVDGKAAVNCALTPEQAAATLQEGQQARIGPTD